MSRGPPILLANLNHSMRAHDLVELARVDLGVGLAVIAEPYALGDRCYRSTNPDRQVAMTWEVGRGAPPCSVAQHGRGWMAAKWGNLLVVGCYLAPRISVPEFEDRLSEVGAFLAPQLTQPVVLLGDFNAHAREWGAPRTVSRGEVLLEWAEAMGFVLTEPLRSHNVPRTAGRVCNRPRLGQPCGRGIDVGLLGGGGFRARLRSHVRDPGHLRCPRLPVPLELIDSRRVGRSISSTLTRPRWRPP